jgi:hypothetical protein
MTMAAMHVSDVFDELVVPGGQSSATDGTAPGVFVLNNAVISQALCSGHTANTEPSISFPL